MKKTVCCRKQFYGRAFQSAEHPQIVLAGQPNCGKSTIFNEVVGYRSIASNFPGATVTYTRGHVRIFHQTFDIIDLPGTYSLTSMDPASVETQRYLLSQHVDVIVNVVDSSILSRSLELTLQLMDLEIPMVLCLNMMDEAERKGIHINTDTLSGRMGMPVIATVASKGRGVQHLFAETLRASAAKKTAHHILYSRHVESVMDDMNRHVREAFKGTSGYPQRLIATKLLEEDQYFIRMAREHKPDILKKAEQCRKQLVSAHGRPADQVIGAERHALSMSIFESVALVEKPVISWKERADNLLMHNVWGYVILFAVMLSFFLVVFQFGALLEEPLVTFFNQWAASIQISPPLLSFMAKGMFQGIGGGIAIVLPYLLPFLLGLAFLEDIGYLPRVAFLLDGVMHRLGLHGTSVIPAVLGYGCNVPAVMATRILETPRDRFIAALIASMVPCSARMTIIFGLVGYALGGIYAFGIYVLNLLVIIATGTVFSRLLKEDTPGMILEIPNYHTPRFKVLLSKTWLRMKDFIIIAWPLLIAGSAVLSLSEFFQWTPFINRWLTPITRILGLPPEVGVTLIFGVLRKELSLLMLFQALGTSDVTAVMTQAQIMTFTIFVVFYIPCVATIGVLIKQVRLKATLLIVLITVFWALMLGIFTRGIAALIH